MRICSLLKSISEILIFISSLALRFAFFVFYGIINTCTNISTLSIFGGIFYAVIYCTYSFGTLLRKPQGILECSHDPLRIWMYLLLYHDDFLYYTSYPLGDYTLPDSSRRCSFPSSVF